MVTRKWYGYFGDGRTRLVRPMKFRSVNNINFENDADTILREFAGWAPRECDAIRKTNTSQYQLEAGKPTLRFGVLFILLGQGLLL